MSISSRRHLRTSICTIPADVYVDANAGSDANAGTSPAAAVATLSRAYSLASSKAASSASPIRIALRGGTYRQNTALSISATTTNAPIIWAAYRNETPIITGSTVVTGWTETTVNGLRTWTTNVGTSKNFKSLFANSESRFRPRLPTACNAILAAHDTIDRSTQLYQFDTSTTSATAPSFIYKNTDINPSWSNLTDITIVAGQQWISERMPLTAVDSAAKKATISFRPDGYPDGWNSGTAYYVENVKEALTIPGQWYLDRPTGVLTYLPKTGETLGNTTMTIPSTTALLSFTSAKNHTFDGLTFAETDWTHITACTQGGHACPAVITMKQSDAIVFRNCTVRDVGYGGFLIDQDSANCVIDNCNVYNVGGPGVRFASGIDTGYSTFNTHDNSVMNSHIYNGGTLFHQSCGVLAQEVRNTTVRNNHIHDFFYSGVSVGWNWSFNETPIGNNVVEGNHIHDIGKYLLSDMAGIYTLGRQAGTILRSNRVHDVQAYQAPGAGIYFDQGSALITCTGNIIYNNMEGIWSPNYSSGVDITYNIIHDNRDFQISANNNVPGTIPSDLPSYRIKCTNNIITTNGSYLFKTDSMDTISDNNLLWDFAGGLSTLPNAPLHLHIRNRTTHANVAVADLVNPYSPTGAYLYQTLSTTAMLAANTSYYMLADTKEGGGKWYQASVLPTTSGATVVGDVYKSGTDAYNENTGGAAYGPFNFKYKIGAGSEQAFITSVNKSANLRNDYAGELGYTFTVGSQPLTITALGAWPLTAAGTWWSSWQAAGRETNSLVANPLYADYAANNFTLAANSPAHNSPVNFP